jgi:ADP-ribose pyrophosphatase YjhB (NUDIX family)
MPTHLKQRCSLPLILRGFLPFKGQYAFHGGFVPADEMPDAEAFRELIEETGTDSCSSPKLRSAVESST